MPKDVHCPFLSNEHIPKLWNKQVYNKAGIHRDIGYSFVKERFFCRKLFFKIAVKIQSLK